MAKRLLKSLLLPIIALAMAFAFIACDGEHVPAVTYTVTYVIGEGAQGTAPTETDKAVGEKFIIKSAEGITNGDKEFAGWSDGNLTYQVGDEYTMPTKAVTFTAQWDDDGEDPGENPGENPTKYTVTYDLNGGSGTLPTEGDKAKGEKFNLAASTGLTNGDKEFAGWNDGAKTYDAGAEYTMPENAVTLTAQWKDKTQQQPENPEPPVSKYTVTYKHGAAVTENGTAVADITAQNQAAGNYTVAHPSAYYYVVEPKTYLFSGWVNEKNKNDDNPTVYLPGQTLTLGENTTLEALWVTTNETLGWADLSDTLFLYAYPNGTGACWYVDPNDREVWTFFTYTENEGTIKATPVGGTEITGTLNEKGELTMTVQIDGHTYNFAPKQEQPVGVPTFTFQLNGGTGTVPTLIVTEDMKKGDYYMVPMPANTIEPPEGKAFRRWTISDGKGEWNTNAGSKFSADAGVAYTVKPEWKDEVVAPVAPTGTEYSGNWNTPAGTGALGAIPSVNITKVWLDTQSNKLYYVAGGTTKEAAVAVNNEALTAEMKTAYGDDAALYSVTIETFGYYMVVAADKSKLAFAKISDADMKILNGSEFTKVGGSNENAPIFNSAVNAVVVYSSDTEIGYLTLLEDGNGYVQIFTDSYDTIVNNTITYTVENGTLTITSAALYDSYSSTTRINTPVAGTIEGRNVAITLAVGATDYAFQCELYKLTMTNNIPNSEDIVAFYPVEYSLDLTYVEDENYLNIKVNGEIKDASDCSNFVMSAVDTVVEYTYHVYTIVYKAGVGVTGEYTDTVTSPSNYTLKRNYELEFTREGYKLAGWTVNGTDYNQGAKITLTADNTEVVARWNQLYTISYAGVDDASVQTNFDPETTTTAYASTDNYYLPSATKPMFGTTIYFTKSGYTLKGWTSSADIGTDKENTVYNPGSKYTLTQNTTFTAVWETLQTYTVTYDLNGGTGTLPTETAKLAGAKFNLAASTGLTNGEKEFDGWHDGTTKYSAGAEYTMPEANVTLTAQWKDAEQSGGDDGATELTFVGSVTISFTNYTRITINTETLIYSYAGDKSGTDKTATVVEGKDRAYSIKLGLTTCYIQISEDGSTLNVYNYYTMDEDDFVGSLSLQA